MPRYFFDVRDGKYLPDTEGVELPGLAEARNMALRRSAEILRDHPDFWNDGEWSMEVRGSSGLILFTLLFTAIESEHIRQTP